MNKKKIVLPVIAGLLAVIMIAGIKKGKGN